MIEKQTIQWIEPKELLNRVTELKNEGYRLVQIHCTNKDGLEVNYSFDKELQFVDLRFVVDTEIEVMSISSVFFPAFLYENEIKELFGVNFKHISVDYEGHLYKKAVQTPFNQQ